MKTIIKVVIQLKNDETVTYGGDGDYRWFALPNESGDLVIYRDHANMLSSQPIAVFAAGEWRAAETEWVE
jgi:hypothetical protein